MSIHETSHFRCRLLGVLSAVAALSAGGEAWAQASATQPTTSSVTVYQPIQVSKQSDLSFGVVVRPATAAGDGSVIINPLTGARTVTNGVAEVNINPAPSRAAFTITGEGGAAYSVSIPAQVTMQSGSNSIVVSLTTTYDANQSPKLGNSLGTTGTATFGIGGSIPITSTTASGSYSVVFNTTVAYN